ncbi:unnamed protein product [Peronospora farinosa]|uniref:Isochorismatase-like domain-containing protein n=1 Tax=Peronospora farinosa TaxID=134698 RepID=A0ABN8BWE1_9STRA|nr:unnamed protein product [Peronospora farinosa]
MLSSERLVFIYVGAEKIRHGSSERLQLNVIYQLPHYQQHLFIFINHAAPFRVAAATVVTAGGVLVQKHSYSKMTFMNECSTNIDLYTHLTSIFNIPTNEIDRIISGGSVVKTIRRGYEGYFRNGSDDAATLIGISTTNVFREVLYNLNVTPPNLNPGFESCKTLDECKQHSKSGIGFNTPIRITPISNTNGKNCREITCLADGCEDAYTFPKDDIKKHSCRFNTNYKVTFCPSRDTTPQETTTAGPSLTGNETTQVSETTTPVTVQSMNIPAKNEGGYGQSDGVVSEVTKKVDTPAPTVNGTDIPAPKVDTPALSADTPALNADTPVTRLDQAPRLTQSSVTKRLGRLLPHSSALFVCDVQEIFRSRTFQMPTVIHGTNTMISAAKLLDIPMVVTTQYSSRLGTTVSAISKNLKDVQNIQIFDKMKFSMLIPEVEDHLTFDLPQCKSVLLCGLETHVCVLQTCLDLLEKGYDVHVISDAVSSSTSYNRSIALDRMRQSGAYITSVESAIFQLTHDASNPEFKNISKLIKKHLQVENGFETGARIEEMNK